MTCLVLTRNRRQWLPKALACIEAQTYRNRETLIVASGESVADLASGSRLIHLGGKPTIGAARNAGCAMARGSVIAHFDDDDYSAPGRLADQVERIRAGAAVTGYHSMRFTDGERWWKYTSTQTAYALGTSLCYRRDWWEQHRYPDVQVGEDNAFVAAARPVLVSVDAGEMMHATIHPGNTSPRLIGGRQWRAL